MKWTRMLVTPLLIIYVTLNMGCHKDDDGNNSNATVTDVDGNTYHTVVIGNQTWMKENLKVEHYRNGESILQKDCTNWGANADPAFCFLNDNLANEPIYGLLYNWYAVNDSRNITPEGWHIPSNTEWQNLIDNVGGQQVAGGNLKEKGNSHWDSPNEGATDVYGFTALPGGYLDLTSSINCNQITPGSSALFWTIKNDIANPASAYVSGMAYDVPSISDPGALVFSSTGCSVRCVKD